MRGSRLRNRDPAADRDEDRGGRGEQRAEPPGPLLGPHPREQRIQHLGRRLGGIGLRRAGQQDPLGLRSVHPVQQRRQPRERGEFLAALVALTQVRVDSGALRRFDRAYDVDTE